MRPLILLLASACVSAPLRAQSPDVQRQLIAARDTIWHAWFSNDSVLLRRFLPPAATSLDGSSNARWSDRAQIVRDARGFVQSKSHLLELGFANTQFALAGSSALVHSNYRYIVESGSHRDTVTGRATELFVHLGNTWVNPYWQLEPSAPKPASPRP